MSSNYEIVADKIFRFPRALSDYDYVKASEFLAETSSNWRDNEYVLADDGPTRKEVELNPSATMPEWKHFFSVIHNTINEYCNAVLNRPYKDHMESIPDNMIDVVHVSKYRVGGGVEPHSDEDYKEDNGVYTVIWYLNDDYEGGEIGFSDYGLEIKPERGDIYIYPSYYMHYAKNVTKGEKYISIRITEV
jgi:hypothetical protein